MTFDGSLALVQISSPIKRGYADSMISFRSAGDRRQLAVGSRASQAARSRRHGAAFGSAGSLACCIADCPVGLAYSGRMRFSNTIAIVPIRTSRRLGSLRYSRQGCLRYNREPGTLRLSATCSARARFPIFAELRMRNAPVEPGHKSEVVFAQAPTSTPTRGPEVFMQMIRCPHLA